MSLEITLQNVSSDKWLDYSLAHFDEFLIDHAACERKASATGIQFVVRYPDKLELAEPMIRLAREELLHFHQVMRLIIRRGMRIHPDQKDPYVNGLLKELRHKHDQNFLDRLLVFGIIEARGTERFGLMGQHHPDPELKDFYEKLSEAEARHHQLFIDLAMKYFEEPRIEQRLAELIEREAQILRDLPLRAAVH